MSDVYRKDLLAHCMMVSSLLNVSNADDVIVKLSILLTTLELIAAPLRPDGTWNRDREACRQLAQRALDALRTPSQPV